MVAGRYIVVEEGGDGLVDDWGGRLAFVNPPFSKLLVWLRRAHSQWLLGNVTTAVCLVPTRTDSAWLHETLSRAADIFLLQGRIAFLDAEGGRQPTPFSTMVVALGSTLAQREAFAALVPGFWFVRSDGGGPEVGPAAAPSAGQA